MGAVQIIKFAIKYLPQLIDLIKYLIERTEEGIQEAQLKKELAQITAAFALANRPQAARDLNNVFRGRP